MTKTILCKRGRMTFAISFTAVGDPIVTKLKDGPLFEDEVSALRRSLAMHYKDRYKFSVEEAVLTAELTVHEFMVRALPSPSGDCKDAFYREGDNKYIVMFPDGEQYYTSSWRVAVHATLLHRAEPYLTNTEVMWRAVNSSHWRPAPKEINFYVSWDTSGYYLCPWEIGPLAYESGLFPGDLAEPITVYGGDAARREWLGAFTRCIEASYASNQTPEERRQNTLIVTLNSARMRYLEAIPVPVPELEEEEREEIDEDFCKQQLAKLNEKRLK